MEIEQIEQIVKRTLSDKRYYHSVCVMEMCEELAKRYNADILKAKKIGLAHDIAKEIPDDKKLSYAKANNISIDYIEEKYPGLLHGKIGADIAKKTFGFSDDMCDAIKIHTTTKENMNVLSKILYMADWIGKDRKFSDTNYLRKLAFKNIDEAIVYAISQTILEKLNKQDLIHPDGILARNFLLK